MKRILTITIPLAVLIVALVALGVLEGQRGPDWQVVLDKYIANSALPSESITVQSVIEARQPGEFTEEMGEAVRNDWRWKVSKLPFPPLAVQCVLLERTRESDGAEDEPLRQVVFVGHHSDGLYRVGWLVHEGPKEPFSPELQAHLDAIGCAAAME